MDALNFHVENVEDIERHNLAYYELKRLLFRLDEKWNPARIWCESSSNAIELIDDVKQTITLPIMTVIYRARKLSD